MDKQLHCRQWGDKTKPTLVLLHGFMGSSLEWMPFAESLGKRCHCLAFDLPGHGKSDKVQVETIPAFDEVMDLILTQVPAERFNLFGYSLGGRIAMHIAKRYPHRILSLTLESANRGILTELGKTVRLKDDASWQQLMEQQGMRAFLNKWYRQPVFAEMSEERRQTMIVQRLGNDPKALAAMFLGTSMGHQQDMADLAVPTVLMTGDRDSKYTEMAKQWPSTQLDHRLIEHAGHNIHASQPAEFIATLLGQLS
ncbi:2-succinyl-6-hydroxy-2,4-cyclohexadiene-1-carboxylate synthase [Ferrimonas lipolytica]|uniref:Putative 2-succinyl-6-hydroxy-2,4-cyclohexadiene-1-carboxylate synthase n=1 Tax=Ferrimonas lipolytica TaxID=2724191 RepID=A0A6H1UIN7_9GAMM|nr:2-succinyl-6-hydroxy-2,4-cyclohexadiene-1-carboxylate synthase [Ferrimonas lipolytica]QIZ78183.1 2-succinyl-6-hydroxy-2,4-cyclohexadiene-1-carboxylate synthase [Ferrimonas lipolytica]